MKRTLACLLACILTLSVLAGCGPKQGGQSSSDPTSSAPGTSAPGASSSQPTGEAGIRLTVLSGPTGIGAAKLLADNAAANQPRYTADVVAANDEVTAALIKGETDIAAVATNVAANLAAKTDGAVQVLAVNTLGVLYILEKGSSVHTISDLRGKTLYAPSSGQGTNPEYVLNYLLVQNDIDPADVNIQWLTVQEITTKMSTGSGGICMLPVPAASAVLLSDSQVRQAISLSDEWDKLEQGSLPMGCVVARTDFIQENPQAVADFLSDYQASIAYMSDPANLDEAAQLVAQFEITANQAVAAKAIPQCNLTYLSGDEMKQVLEEYYQILFLANPASIGGSMPYDSFYYGVG